MYDPPMNTLTIVVILLLVMALLLRRHRDPATLSSPLDVNDIVGHTVLFLGTTHLVTELKSSNGEVVLRMKEFSDADPDIYPSVRRK